MLLWLLVSIKQNAFSVTPLQSRFVSKKANTQVEPTSLPKIGNSLPSTELDMKRLAVVALEGFHSEKEKATRIHSIHTP